VTILLVDDDVDLGAVTADALRRQGYTVLVATDGQDALRQWRAEQPPVVVLEVGLPDMDGLRLCRTLRQTGKTAVILISANGDDEAVVAGFKAGADDYVTKPFSQRLLGLRIQAVARGAVRPPVAELPENLVVGELELDANSYEVHRDERAVRLTPIEFRLLYLLARNPGRVISGARLCQFAWDRDSGDTAHLKTHFSHLRRKLATLATGDVTITAIPRVGYRFAWQRSTT